MFLSKNWNVRGGGAAVTLPFDSQLGPSKAVSLTGTGLKLSKSGLWRADGHVTFYAAPSSWGSTVVTAAATIAVVRSSDKSTYTAKQYDMVLTTYGPETSAFSHTFVVPDPDAFEVVVKAVASYFTVSAGTLALRLWPRESWAITGIRELGYLALAVAFLNLLLTLIRVIRSSDDR